MFKPPLNRQPTQEILLLDLVERLGRLRTGRVAVRLHLSTLPATFRRAPYLNVAQTTFAASVRHCEGQLFALGNADLVFVGKKSDASLLDTAVNRLRVIFGEPEQAEFCTWYDLETAGLASFCSTFTISDWTFSISFVRRIFSAAANEDFSLS